ncbi:MAG: sensor histidine kinase [Myxococcota bacterium]
MPRRGLWVEIGLNLALLTVAVSVLDAGVFYVVTRGALVDAGSDLAERSAAVIAQQLTNAGPDGWKRVVEGHRGERGVTVYALSGEVLAGDDVPADATVRAVVATRDVASRVAEGMVEAVAPVGGPGRPQAVLAVRMPVTTASRPAWTVVGVHAVVSAALVLVFGLVLFRRSVLTPIGQLQEGTRRVAAGEPAKLTEDAPAELAELARALNAMGEALGEYRSRTAEQLARLEAANAQLQAAQEALVRSEKLASVGRLAAGLAHELGNPLTAVRGYLEVLAMESDDEVLRRARVEAERMHELLRDLLDFARHEGREVADVDVAGLLEEAARTVRHQQAFREIEVAASAPPGLTLRGETPRLHQVLVNLLLNAADAGARHVRLAAEPDGEGLAIRCADDGSGIPAAHLARLFEPFFTTRPPGKGTGLGLAIAHKVVEQHGGRIDVRSVVGEGTEFVLRFPGMPARGLPAA